MSEPRRPKDNLIQYWRDKIAHLCIEIEEFEKFQLVNQHYFDFKLFLCASSGIPFFYSSFSF